MDIIELAKIRKMVGGSGGGSGDGGSDAEKYFEGGYAEVILPNATKIKPYAFYQDSVLTDISMPKVTSIGQNAFYGCAKLTSINLPLVTSIGQYAFYQCAELSCVILRAEAVYALSNANAFNNTPFGSGRAGGTLLVPRSLVESYKTATNWSVLWERGNNRFLALEDYTVDGTITGEIDWEKLNGGAA